MRSGRCSSVERQPDPAPPASFFAVNVEALAVADLERGEDLDLADAAGKRHAGQVADEVVVRHLNVPAVVPAGAASKHVLGKGCGEWIHPLPGPPPHYYVAAGAEAVGAPAQPDLV